MPDSRRRHRRCRDPPASDWASSSSTATDAPCTPARTSTRVPWRGPRHRRAAGRSRVRVLRRLPSHCWRPAPVAARPKQPGDFSRWQCSRSPTGPPTSSPAPRGERTLSCDNGLIDVSTGEYDRAPSRRSTFRSGAAARFEHEPAGEVELPPRTRPVWRAARWSSSQARTRSPQLAMGRSRGGIGSSLVERPRQQVAAALREQRRTWVPLHAARDRWVLRAVPLAWVARAAARRRKDPASERCGSPPRRSRCRTTVALLGPRDERRKITPIWAAGDDDAGRPA
jgi:hypothetical protein